MGPKIVDVGVLLFAHVVGYCAHLPAAGELTG
jgi:hypothetical protein